MTRHGLKRPWSPASTGISCLDLGVTRHGSAPAAGGQGAERPERPPARLRSGLGHPADPLFNPADFGEGPGSVYLLRLVVV
jgi:hypothetical protein